MEKVEYASPDEVMYEYDHLSPDYDDTDYDDNLYQGGLSPFSFAQIVEHCLEPTVKDGLRHIGKVLIWCVVFRLATQSGSGTLPIGQTPHIVSTFTGLVVLAHFFYLNTAYVVALAVITYFGLLMGDNFGHNRRGVVVALICFTFNMSCELFFASPADWHTIRGAQMILSMKAISLGFDLDQAISDASKEETIEVDDEAIQRPIKGLKNRRQHRTSSREREISKEKKSVEKDNDLTIVPRPMEYLGYLFCPGNCIFGPWVKYSEYLNIYLNPRWNATWFVKIVFTLAFSLMFLTISTCWNPWLIPDYYWRWWIAYRDAMSFRASHYFVSYVAEATAVAAGFGSSVEGSTVQWNGMQVTQPHNIEVPRSLIDVVVSWNVPMHKWLKAYCFKTTIRKYGTAAAIFVTYVASTMLHGLNFQLGAVLFSLGFYTYTEHTFRKRLAQIFDASIAAKRGSHYKYKEGQTVVILVNLLFGLLACFHLAYLGAMFSQQEELMMEGYSWKHTIGKWQALDFTSHWIVLVTFLLTFLI